MKNIEDNNWARPLSVIVAGIGFLMLLAASCVLISMIETDTGKSQHVPYNQSEFINNKLLDFQKNQILNAEAELAHKEVSLNCLNALNSNDLAFRAAQNSASCLGPGYGIKPPELPFTLQTPNLIQCGGKYCYGPIDVGNTYEVEPNGVIYAISGDNASYNDNETQLDFAGDAGIAFYQDGILITSRVSHDDQQLYSGVDGLNWFHGYQDCFGGNGHGFYDGKFSSVKAIDGEKALVCHGNASWNGKGEYYIDPNHYIQRQNLPPDVMGYYSDGFTVTSW